MEETVDPLAGKLTADESRLLHELQVLRIELELQNESLREALAQAEEANSVAEQARERYVELFDFAPIAYFILEPDGAIRKANFRGARLLGAERSRLIRQNIRHYILGEDRQAFVE